jgi:glycosyltransferase involved in cell wall biosynthesis
LVPSYDTGERLVSTVREALTFWCPVWVVIDGSRDGSEQALKRERALLPGMRIIVLPQNQGKGAAVLAGMMAAHQEGFEYALVMDSDGQHPANCIPRFMDLSRLNPSAMILGVPDFGPEAPAARRKGRRIGNWWTNVETLWGGIEDSLFGFRVYPLAASIDIMQKNARCGRRFDFDTELAVRLYWSGVKPINVAVPVRYLTPQQGGISHFHYVRDNLLLIKAHTFLMIGMLRRFPTLWRMRKR